MTLRQAIRAKIKELKGDCRMRLKPADVYVNAPLALIQTDLEGKIAALNWVLKQLPKGKSC